MKRREDEAIFSDTIILFASFYAFVLITLQSFLHVKVNIHPVLTGEMRMRQINSHFSKNTLCVLCCAQLFFLIITLPLRQWTVPLKSVNGYVRASKPFNQHLHPVKSQWLCNKSVVTFSFSRVVYISTQLQIKNFIIQTVLFKQCFIANGRVFKMKVIQTICICHAESIALEFLKYNSCVVWS